MTFASLAARDTEVRELMDDPGCDPVRLAATLRRFGAVNRLVAGWAHVYRTRLRPLVESGGRVLDLGCGGGDVTAHLARLGRRDGLDVQWLGADPDPRAIAVAERRSAPGLAFRCVDGTGLLAAGERFDAVISSHVLHHLGPDELRAFADDSLALSRGPVLHSDIARSRAAYLLYGIGITPFAPGTFLRTDGLRSIRRSYRPAELAHALGPRWRIERPVPFRLLAVATPRHEGEEG